MNQSRPHHNPLYRRYSEAAQILRNELNLLRNSSSTLIQEEAKKEEEKKENEDEDDSQREILFLRLILEYFYANRVFPHATDSGVDDFCIKFNMKPDAFIIQLCKYKKNYVKRVIKICKKLQLLDQPHDQDAFDLGNRVWGCRRYEMVSEVENSINLDENETMSQAEEEDEEEEKEGDDYQDGDFLNRYPFLKRTFGFGSRAGKIPVVSENSLENAVDCVGESIVKKWDDKWKNLQIQEMKNFLAQLELMRHQTVTLLNELQNNN
ncbi:hypothetical protein PIB30_001873 [Stylosanthes scabra]|uniref:Uncharacterized protein n=1 Tax=Stylosanthes scabra TaxID=79078 RepID=A0ABU6X0C7_9FABA|nr:hypothetical protein [Stylosanthes scabra]